MSHRDSKTKKVKSVANIDFISNLPEVIKDKILCCLPIKEAVRTCMLSRKWRYTWASLTELVIREDDFALGCGGNEQDDQYRFLRFVDLLLALHSGPILKFELHARRVHMLSPGGYIHRWILMLSRNGLKEIQIRTNIWRNYKIPSCFFSCSDLEYAYLRGCVFQLPSAFKGFKQLHTLHLEDFCVSGNNIGDLVASCPNLETLVLSSLLSFADLNIHSAKLKILTIDGMFNNLSLHTPSLIAAFIKLRVDSAHASKVGCNSNLVSVIRSLSEIKKITLLDRVLEYLARGFTPAKLLKQFNQLMGMTLEIDLDNLEEAKVALFLFQNAPNLQSIELRLAATASRVPIGSFWESIGRHVCLFKNLNVVGMINFGGSGAELAFLKLLLEDAPVLREVQIKENGLLDRTHLKKILKMRRTSKDAEIVI